MLENQIPLSTGQWFVLLAFPNFRTTQARPIDCWAMVNYDVQQAFPNWIVFPLIHGQSNMRVDR